MVRSHGDSPDLCGPLLSIFANHLSSTHATISLTFYGTVKTFNYFTLFGLRCKRILVSTNAHMENKSVSLHSSVDEELASQKKGCVCNRVTLTLQMTGNLVQPQTSLHTHTHTHNLSLTLPVLLHLMYSQVCICQTDCSADCPFFSQTLLANCRYRQNH